MENKSSDQNKDLNRKDVRKDIQGKDIKDIKGTERSADTSRDFSASEGRKDSGDTEMDDSKSTDDFSTDSPLRGRPAPDTSNPQAKSDKNWQDKSH